ncbi:hypothetical protein Tco_0012577 [Tanacetum coccineum]
MTGFRVFRVNLRFMEDVLHLKMPYQKLPLVLTSSWSQALKLDLFSAQNVAFVSSESTSSTNDVSTAYGVSTFWLQSHKGNSFNHKLMNSLYSSFANQISGLHLDHEDLEQLDEFDLEEDGTEKWQVEL